MAGQAAARFEQPLAALGRRRFGHAVRRIDDTRTAGCWRAGTRPAREFRCLRTARVYSRSVTSTARCRPASVIVNSLCSCRPDARSARRTAASASSGGSRPAGESNCRASRSRPSNSRCRKLGPTLRNRPGVSTSFSASASACVAGVSRGLAAGCSRRPRLRQLRIRFDRPQQLAANVVGIGLTRPASSPNSRSSSLRPGSVRICVATSE